MLYKTENQFQNALVKTLRGLGCWVVPIETRSTIGVPDLYIAQHGRAIWIECKMLRLAARGYFVPFRVGQQAWHLKHYKTVGSSVLIMGYYKGKVFSHEMKHIWKDHVIPFDEWEEETVWK